MGGPQQTLQTQRYANNKKLIKTIQYFYFRNKNNYKK